MSNEVTLLTVSWNNLDCLQLMLKSYVKHHYKGEPLKLMLVDNNSTDGTIEWLQSQGVFSINLDENKGHEQAINLFYGDIFTKYCLLVDTDVEFRANVHDAYLPWLNDKCIMAGELITGDQLNSPVKPRIGAWFNLFDIRAARKAGIETFRDKEDWSYDVGSHFTERVFETGHHHYQIDRLPSNIDRDVVGMPYGTHDHLGKMSWDLNNHGDRHDEVMMRKAYVKERLKQYENIDLKGKFTI